MIQFERHGIRWEISTPCEPLLDKLIADPGHAIKVTPTKLVTVHTVEGRTFYVKRYRNTNSLMPVEPLELRRIDVDRGELKPALTDDERSDNLAWLNVNVPLSDKFFEVYGANPGFIRQARQRSDVMRRESRAKFSWRS